MAAPLAHLRALDLSELVAGPYCAKLLGSLGAEVIKIETPVYGDPARHLGPFSKDDVNPERSALFGHLNAGKKSLTLDLKSSIGQDLLHELLQAADIVVESFSPQAKEALGLSHARWQEIKPDIIVTCVTNFGQKGPNRDREASELTLLAEGGYLYQCGDPAREPLKPYGYQGQYVGGLQAAVATMGAVSFRRSSGRGQVIDVSLQESVALLTAGAIAWYNSFGVTFHRAGSRVSASAARQAYSGNLLPCKDGHVFISAGQNQEMLALLVGEPKLASKELWKKAAHYAEEIDEACRSWLKDHTRAEVVQRAQELRVAVTPVLNLEEVLHNDQLNSRQAFDWVYSPEGEAVAFPTSPFRFSPCPLPKGLRPPELGEHNAEVLHDLLGLSDRDLSELFSLGVI